MLRWLLRLLFVGIILAAIGFVVSRLMGRDEDFDDFDDIDDGFDFQETPVEIDVPAEDNTKTSGVQTAALSSTVADEVETRATLAKQAPAPKSSENSQADTQASASTQDTPQTDATESPEATGAKLIDINGVGPAYEARLHAMGIETFDDLIKADPATLSEQLGVIGGQSAVEDWISQARDLASGDGQNSNSNA